MSIKSGYKQTEIGVIPEDWELVEIKQLGTVVTGSTPKTANKEFYENGTRLWASPSDLGKSKEIKNTSTKLSDLGFEQTRILPPRSILVNCIGSTIGKIGIAYEEMSTNQQINSVVCNEKNNSDFYYYVLDQKKEYIKKLAGTQAVPLLNKTDFSIIKVIQPPLEEQKKIADILSTVDKKIAFVEENINATEKLKKGLMQKLLTEGIGHTEFKDSELGRIPESWEVESLDNFSDITKLAGFEFTEYFDYEAGGDIIAIRALNVVNGKLVLNNLQRISSEISNKLLRSKLYVNDILFTYVGTLGQVAMIEENDKYHLAPNVAKITIENQDKVISKFLLFYLISNFGQKQIKLLSTTTSQPAINMGNIRKIKLPVPQIEEQKQIAEILSTVDNKLENLKEKKLFFQELKKGLMQKLLTGEVRV